MATNNCNNTYNSQYTKVGQRVRRIPVSTLTIGTWNVKTLFAAGKLDNAEQEMKRLKLNILGISEIRWLGNGKCPTDEGMLYYSGNNDNNHMYGVGIMLTREINKSVINFLPYSDRLMMLQLRSVKNNINLIQAYAPTADKDDQLNEEFYEQLSCLLKYTKKHDITFILGDFNAKIGKGACGEYVGNYGLGERNNRGDRLYQFCQEEDLIVSNTFFKLPPRRLYTWKSPKDRTDNIVRNQIDYILVRKKYKKDVKSVRTYPGADIGSDHNPVIMRFRVRLRKIQKRKIQNNTDISYINEPEKQEEIRSMISKKFQTLKNNTATADINTAWTNIKNVLADDTNRLLKPKQVTKKKRWMTNEILDLMEERRKNKNNNIEYTRLHGLIKKKIREAKENWITNQCMDIEALQAKHDSFNIHRKIKEALGFSRSKQANVIRDNNNKIIMDLPNKLSRWKEYVEELFADVRTTVPNLNNLSNANVGPAITLEEVMHAIKLAKPRKAVGPDEIHVDVLKLLEEDDLEVLTLLFNRIYDTGVIPKDWLVSTFITIPKKVNASQCKDFRTISLMSHVLKIFLRILHTRLYKKCESNIGASQFGFRNGFGTREALYSINVLLQRCLDVNKDVYACFIDYEKAFDKVQHQKLIDILVQCGMDDKDIRIIANLYWQQTANVRVENATTEEANILRGVRQGCILSPMLFNLYSETIFREALQNETEGIRVNGQIINNIRYADDTVLLADNVQDLLRLIHKVNTVSETYGLTMNFTKTKYMVFSKNIIPTENLILNNKQIERVQKYKYLGSWLTDSLDCLLEVRTRIEIAREAFIKMKSLLTTNSLKLDLRLRIVRCYVFSILLYGMETWTLKQEHIKKLEAFEMWVYRRMLKISWVDRITNIQVLSRMKKEREIILTIKRRKLEYLGHIMRGDRYQLQQLIIQGKIIGKRSVGRRRTSWLKNLREWYGCTSAELFRATVNKVKIALMVANLQREKA